MKVRFYYIILACFITCSGFSQSKLNTFLTPSDTLNKPRRNLVVISEASIATVTLIGLNQLWYADYPKSNFHTLNDNSQWLQMDKLGHTFSSYQLGRAGANMLAWSGASKKNQLIYGSTIGLAFLTAVEVFDGGVLRGENFLACRLTKRTWPLSLILRCTISSRSTI